MLPTTSFMKSRLKRTIEMMADQGHEVGASLQELEQTADSLDALLTFARRIKDLPMRADWEYVEPTEYAAVEAEMSPRRFDVLVKTDDTAAYAVKAEAAFLGSVLGCILGKPLEVNPTWAELQKAGEACGAWPIQDFISERFLEALGRRHESWSETIKENIQYVAADDDLHYSVMGMLNLEKFGLGLDAMGVKDTWLRHQSINFVWGPERLMTAVLALDHLMEEGGENAQTNEDIWQWGEILNPGNELCGAAIRADAYGYAFAGRPDLAAKYAFIDASFTHRRTGVYSTMYIAAAISLMFVAKDPMQAFADALLFIPQRSRFHRMMSLCLEYVATSTSFEDGYNRIHNRFGEYDHCKVYQEVGTLANTLKYAENVWDGVCKQVMQGNDTDSFGCTAGSLLGAWFGVADHERLRIFNGEIQISLASFHEHSLSALAKRMGQLPVALLKQANAQ